MHTSAPQDTDLIAGFYEAATDPAGWNSAWQAVCHAFGADIGLLFQQEGPRARPRMMALTDLTGAAPHGDAGDVGALSPFAELLESIGYRGIFSQWMAPFDAACAPSVPTHALGAEIKLAGAARAGLGLRRPRGAPAFESADRFALDRISRHLAAALRLENALAQIAVASAARGAVLDQLSHGTVISDATGAIHYANDAALYLAASGGLVFGKAEAGLTCERPAEAAALARLLASAATGGAGGSTRISRNRLPILAVTVTPLRVSLSAPVAGKSGRGLALAIIRDLGATSDAPASQLMDLFGLTGAEAGILPQLLAGDSAALIAQSRGVAPATVRAQVARVLSKTGAQNLRALASMIAALGCG